MRNNYLFIYFAMVVLAVAALIFKNADFKFQSEYAKQTQKIVYKIEDKEIILDELMNGKGTLVLKSIPKEDFSCAVIFADGQKQKASVKKVGEGTYQFEVENKDEKEYKELVIQNVKEEELLKAPFTSLTVDTLYTYTKDYIMTDNYLNENGIDLGCFKALNPQQLNSFKSCTIEVCYEDEAKSDGYQLIGRTVKSVKELLETRIGFIPYLNDVKYDNQKLPQIILTFEGESTKTIVLGLKGGAE